MATPMFSTNELQFMTVREMLQARHELTEALKGEPVGRGYIQQSVAEIDAAISEFARV